MGTLYDGYQLTNSQATPAFVGSDVDTKIGVLQQLNQRYLQTKEADDMLSRTLKDSVVSANDQPLYNQITQKYRDNIAQRTKSGNYEDMQMQTAKDAYDFAGQYKAFAMNYGLQQNHHTEIQKASDRGADGRAGIGNDIADMLHSETYAAPGLKIDPETGRITNFFRAPAIAIGTDKPKKVKEWASDVVAQETGHEVKSIQEGSDGQLHYVTTAGTSGIVTPQQLHKAVQYGMKIDDQYRNDVQQESRLRTNGLDRYNYDDVAAVHPEAAKKIQAEADRTGQSFGTVYRQMVRQNIEDSRGYDLQQYATKYLRNDHTSKQLDDLVDPSSAKNKNPDTLGVTMNIPLPGHEFNSPDAITDELVASKGRLTTSNQAIAGYMKGNNDYRQPIVSTPDGRYTTKDGKTDVTQEVKNQQAQLQAEQNHQTNLSTMDSDAQKAAGYHMTPQLQAKAKAAAEDAVNFSKARAAISGGLNKSDEDRIYKNAFDGALNSDPRYSVYKNLLAQRAAGMVGSTVVTRFPKEDDNKQMEALGNGLTVNDFKKSLVGGWKLGTNGQNTPLDPSDYDNLKGDINFTGMGKDANGDRMALYSATNKKTGDKVTFGLKNVVSNQNMAKMMNIDPTQDAIDSEISRTLNNPAHSGDITVSGSDTKLHIAVTNPDQVNQGGKENYRAILQAKDGRQLVLDAPDKAALIKHVQSYYAAHASQ